MCGFVGYVRSLGGQGFDADAEILVRAASAIRHRGPDDAGTWVSDDGRAGLGFRRLAILDLSAHGHQPMASSDGRYVLTFNGEIYNFKDLRARLDGEAHPAWRGHSDTEVLLEWIVRHGVRDAVSQADGMFAIALWDTAEQTLTLARDKFGEKPLYYGWSDGGFVFGSELKALKALPGFRDALDVEALAQYFRYRYVPAPKTIYAAYSKLTPGTILTLKGGDVSQARYWDPVEQAAQAFATPFAGNYDQALDAVEDALTASTRRRLESDVPLGAFLSGGIDSSLAVALAGKAGHGVNTFTIAFAEKHFNEGPYARAVAEHLKANHLEIEVSERDALAQVDALPAMFDEPFADPSQLPTAVLCARAREHVTVALAGDGGDELFCGYGRYLDHVRRFQALKGLNDGERARALAWAKRLPVGLLDGLDGLRGKPGKLGRKWLAKLMDRATAQPEAFFLSASAFWRDGVPVKGVGALELDLFAPPPLVLDGVEDVRRFQILDTVRYLPDDVLVKTDRASMAASLEVRTPFLNADLARLAWSLPFAHTDPERVGLKAVLKDVLARHVPRELFERPKMGFDAPIRQWLRGDLKRWGEGLVNDPSALALEHLDMERIRARWSAHQRGLNAEGDLWPALVMLAWMQAD